jgi:signal transduction histidine kinase
MDRIDAIAGRMLRFSGPVRGSVAAVDLHETLEHALRLAQPRLQEKAILVKRLFQAAPALARGEEVQLQQAFLNLFLNAADAMPSNGTLTLTTRAPAPTPGSESPQIYIAVEDTGAGIAPENMGRLFEPFFTTKPHGTGLGLSITRRIIQEHQGDISVRSQAGKGTVFEILLPAAPGLDDR